MSPPKAEPKALLKIAGETVELELPDRPSARIAINSCVRQEGMLQVQATAILVVSAALGLCWPAFGRKDDAPRYRHNVLEYGAEMLDFLYERGDKAGQSVTTTLNEIIEAGNEALEMIQASLVKTEDLVEAKGNSKGQTGSSSGKSSE